MTKPLRQAWDDQAEAWTAWARAPGHDTFWVHTLPELLELVPAPGRLTVDLGAGEGRLARELTSRGHRTVAVDGAPALAARAATHPDASPTAVGDLAHLPVRAGAADLAVACMVLQDVDDLDGAVRETARALAPGGRLVAAIVHPLNSAGRFADPSPDAPFVIAGSYLTPFRYTDDVERNGLRMTFHSMHRPLEAYARALEDAGLVIEALREPAWADADQLSRTSGWDRVPLFCFLRAAKPAGAASPGIGRSGDRPAGESR